MIEILVATWVALIGLLSGAWSIVEEVLVWVWSVLYHLHVDAPRLEGLLIGILLTWLLLRRDNHPILRILSAPLKLVIDILDLIWDQIVEILGDVKETIVGWFNKTVGLAYNKAKSGWLWVIQKLSNVKDRLSKKANKDQEG